MEPKKKNKNVFLIIMILLFITFISLYISQIGGYYEFTQYNKKTITEEAMKQFEKDIEDGKEIKMENYISSSYKDYSNNVSNLGMKTSSSIENFMTKGIKNIFKVIKTLFVD